MLDKRPTVYPVGWEPKPLWWNDAVPFYGGPLPRPTEIAFALRSGVLIVCHEDRCQPYTVWSGEEVISFSKTPEEAIYRAKLEILRLAHIIV